MRKIIKKRDIKLIETALIAAIVSVGGWLIFSGVTKLLSLDKMTPISSIIFGLIIVYLSFKFGLSKK